MAADVALGGAMSLLGFAMPSMLAIDHVLVAQEFRVTDTASVTIQGTDHRALLATLVLQ